MRHGKKIQNYLKTSLLQISMNVDIKAYPMKKLIVGIGCILSLLFLWGCVSEKVQQPDAAHAFPAVSQEKTAAPEIKTIDVNPAAAEPADDITVPVEESSLQENVQHQTATAAVSTTKRFDIEVGNWYFKPEVIEVNAGDTVVLNIKTVSGVHGLGLPDFGINQQLIPGEDVQIKFTADKKGDFSFFCSVACGLGHNKMRGKLVVH